MHSLTKPSQSSYVRFNKGQFFGRLTSFAQKECTNRKGDLCKSLLIQFLAPQIVPSPSNKGEIKTYEQALYLSTAGEHTHELYSQLFWIEKQGTCWVKNLKASAVCVDHSYHHCSLPL